MRPCFIRQVRRRWPIGQIFCHQAIVRMALNVSRMTTPYDAKSRVKFGFGNSAFQMFKKRAWGDKKTCFLFVMPAQRDVHGGFSAEKPQNSRKMAWNFSSHKDNRCANKAGECSPYGSNALNINKKAQLWASSSIFNPKLMQNVCREKDKRCGEIWRPDMCWKKSPFRVCPAAIVPLNKGREIFHAPLPFFTDLCLAWLPPITTPKIEDSK